MLWQSYFFLSRSCCSQSSSCQLLPSTFNFCENVVGCVLTTKRHDSQRAWPVWGRAEGLDKKIWDSGLESRSTDQRKEHAQQRGSHNFHESRSFGVPQRLSTSVFFSSSRWQRCSSRWLSCRRTRITFTVRTWSWLSAVSIKRTDWSGCRSGQLRSSKLPKTTNSLEEQTHNYLLICFFFQSLIRFN